MYVYLDCCKACRKGSNDDFVNQNLMKMVSCVDIKQHSQGAKTSNEALKRWYSLLSPPSNYKKPQMTVYISYKQYITKRFIKFELESQNDVSHYEPMKYP